MHCSQDQQNSNSSGIPTTCVLVVTQHVLSQNVVNVAKFPDCGWETEAQTWRLLDNVLAENHLLSEEQMQKLGITRCRYIPPEQSTRVCVCVCVCVCDQTIWVFRPIEAPNNLLR